MPTAIFRENQRRVRKSDSSTQVVMDERLEINPSDVRRTADGYLVTMPRIARTGVQIYAGHEVGRPDLDEVRVYRPPEEVFDEAAMHSYAHRPVTVDHPPEPVNASNWKKFAVGQTGAEVVRDGRFIRVPMVVMDQAAIEVIDKGKTQLSNSYACNLHWEDGVDEDGKPYDAVQRCIRGNHLAIVANARGGVDLRIGDDKAKGESPMALHMVDGVRVEMTDTAIELVNRALTARDEKIKTLSDNFEAFQEKEKKKKEMEEQEAKDTAVKRTTEMATKDAEIAKLKKELADASISPDKLDELVKDREALVAKAQAILGDALIVKGKTDDEIRRQVVLAHVGDAAKDWDARDLRTSFASITAKITSDQQQQQTQLSGGKFYESAGEYLADAARTLGKPTAAQLGDAEKAYNERSASLQGRWKQKPAAA